jgi:hypothetical protein
MKVLEFVRQGVTGPSESQAEPSNLGQTLLEAARLGLDISPLRTGNCVCGRPVTDHFDHLTNNFISCSTLAEQAAE